MVDNYRLVSLLPYIFGKIFEKTIFNSIFQYVKRKIYYILSSLADPKAIAC